MEDLIACKLPLWLQKTFQLGDWNITNEDSGSFGWFALCQLLDVVNGEINRPCQLISTEV